MLLKVKEVKKEAIVHEVKELLAIILYLAVCLSLVATFKGLILFQLDINDFLHLYSVAIIEAFVFGKVVAITQKLPLVNAWDNRPLLWSVLYKSVVMTIIVDTANALEEKIFTHAHHSAPALHPLIFFCAHQTLILLMFFVLYTARGLDRKLGHGTLLKLITEK